MAVRVNGVCVAIAALLVISDAIEARKQPTEWINPEPVTSNPGVTNPPSVARGGLHGVDIIYTGSNRRMFHQWTTGGPLNAPQDIGLVGTSTSPSAIAKGRHKLDVFYYGSEGGLWTRWSDTEGVWSDGERVGTFVMRSPPFAIANGLHKIDVFFAGTDGTLYTTWWDGGDWSPAKQLSDQALMEGAAAAPPPIRRMRRAPVAVVNGPHLVDVLYVIKSARGNWGELRTVWSNGKGSSLIGDWSVPMEVKDAAGSSISGVKFVGSSSIGGASGLTINGSWTAHVFFTDTVGGGPHIGRLMDLQGRQGQAWFLDSTTVGGGSRLSAGAINQVFMINEGLGDPDHPPGLVFTCRLPKPFSPDERRVNCFQFP